MQPETRALFDQLAANIDQAFVSAANWQRQAEDWKDTAERHRDSASRLAASLAECDQARLAAERQLGIAERMARYLGWAFKGNLIMRSETAELLDQVVSEWNEARVSSNQPFPVPDSVEETRVFSLGLCPRCNSPLNNISPGISVIAGGVSVCTPCVRQGEEELLRAR